MRFGVTFAVLAVMSLSALVAVPTYALFSGTTTNTGSTFGSAASFPTYPASVTGDSAWSYYRQEQSPSSAATLAATDSSGNARTGTYNGVTNGPSTFWKLEENTGSSTADSSGAANTGTLGNTPTWTTGNVGNALSFNGTTQYVAGARTAVNTAQAFSVAAWVYLTDDSLGRVAVSQSGSISSGFMLRYNPWVDAWDFTMTDSNSYTPSFESSVSATNSAVPNVWVHLVGVYNGAGSIQLYVNGAAKTAVAHNTAWNATGALQIGRVWEWGSWQGANSGYAPWAGKVDEVRVFQRALTAAEALSLGSGLPVTDWEFTEGAGTSVADRGVNGVNGTLAGASAWTTAGHDGNGMSFDGSVGTFVNGSAAVLDTSTSFSVAAWVYLTTKAQNRTAVSQDGTTISGFYLQYDSGLDKWVFTMRSSDSDASAITKAADGATTTLNTWYHLVGVHNSGAGNIKLYVNGTLQATTAFASPWNATGTFEVGRGRFSAGPVDRFAGNIDGVKVYQRALSAAEITDLSTGANYTETDMSAGLTGALQGAQQGQTSTTAVAYAGRANGYYGTSQANPAPFTIECWFRTASTTGGVIMNLGGQKTGTSSNRDRAIYLDSGNKVSFDVNPSTHKNLRSTATYNDGAWHHVAASVGAAGQKLYLDGDLVASDAAVTTAQNFTGYWRWGGESTSGWSNAPTTNYFTGTIDEVAIYTTQLTDNQIARHYAANH